MSASTVSRVSSSTAFAATSSAERRIYPFLDPATPPSSSTRDARFAALRSSSSRSSTLQSFSLPQRQHVVSPHHLLLGALARNFLTALIASFFGIWSQSLHIVILRHLRMCTFGPCIQESLRGCRWPHRVRHRFMLDSLSLGTRSNGSLCDVCFHTSCIPASSSHVSASAQVPTVHEFSPLKDGVVSHLDAKQSPVPSHQSLRETHAVEIVAVCRHHRAGQPRFDSMSSRLVALDSL